MRTHDYMPYFEARKGWVCVKAKYPGEQDYYVHGISGETTYEKPLELMSESEKIFFNNFVTHKAAAEEHVERIAQLQLQLEEASYERDSLMYDALQGNAGQQGDTLSKMLKKKAKGASTSTKSMFGKKKDNMYRSQLQNPSDRRRGKNRSDFINNIIDGVEETLAQGKKE
jgi:hypothetical protein